MRRKAIAAVVVLIALGSLVYAGGIDGYDVKVQGKDTPSIDAFGRWRVSNPVTLFDSKQIFDNQPLFWDESLESGGGISTAHSTDTASTVFTSTTNTVGVYTRQTFMRFNYSPGKSQLIYMTALLDKSGGGTGVTRSLGLFDDDNGLFFEDKEGVVGVVRRTSVTGSPANNRVIQSNWNVDTMDGAGPSKVTLDWTKFQIFFLDFEWLGIGRIRFGVLVDGMHFVVHESRNANSLGTVYMSTPNLPLRFQMTTANPSAASTLEAGCSTVISEGGDPKLGIVRRISTGGTHVNADTQDVVYAVVGIRLQAARVGATVKVLRASMAEHAGTKEYEWILLFNPTVADTFTYSNVANSSLQSATGVTANTVTGGTPIGGGFGSSARFGGNQTVEEIRSALRLGVAIDGTTLDTIVLCVRPIGGSTGIDIEGSLTVREQ